MQFKELQNFYYDTKFRPGLNIAHVDVLSHIVNGVTDAQFVEKELSQRLDVFVALNIQEKERFM